MLLRLPVNQGDADHLPAVNVDEPTLAYLASNDQARRPSESVEDLDRLVDQERLELPASVDRILGNHHVGTVQQEQRALGV